MAGTIARKLSLAVTGAVKASRAGTAAAIAPLRAKVVLTDPYPQKALFDFLSAKAPQVGNIT